MERKKILACMLALTLAAITLLSGCASNKLAAKVGDREITVNELANYFANNADYASYYGYALTTAEGIEAFQDYLLDSFISSEMTAYQARKAGITLTEEEKAEAKKSAEESYDSTYQSFVDSAKQSGSSEPEVYAQKIFTDALVQNGTTVSKMKKDLLMRAEDSKLVEKHREALIKDAVLTAEELKAKYDEELASQQETIEGLASMYFTYETNANYGYSCMPLVIPEGLFRVKHILVEDEAKAKEIKEKLDNGEDFDALLQEFGTDPGQQDGNNPDGYLIGEGASFVEPFLNAALALEKEGDISDIVKSDYGYHIIKRLADEPARVLPYEEVKDAFDAYEQNRAQDEHYYEIVEGWVADAALVTRYPENYRDIGKEALVLVTPSPESTSEPAADAVPEAETEDAAQ